MAEGVSAESCEKLSPSKDALYLELLDCQVEEPSNLNARKRAGGRGMKRVKNGIAQYPSQEGCTNEERTVWESSNEEKVPKAGVPACLHLQIALRTEGHVIQSQPHQGVATD